VDRQASKSYAAGNLFGFYSREINFEEAKKLPETGQNREKLDIVRLI
jgi:hypothetical protein